MIKKLLVASSCMMLMASGAFAEKLTKTPVDLEIYGDLEAVYKMQSDYRTPLDSKDYIQSIGGNRADGFDYRSGANNRSQQNVRASGSMTMVAKAGENDYSGSKWYNMIGVMKLKLNPNDPDDHGNSLDNDDSDIDGSMQDNVGLGDVWVRYSPMVALGVKVGVQTIAATANAYGIGHKYAGDLDDDFIYYTSSVVDEKPGISLDFHLSKDIELGAAMLQGMGDLSAIISGGSTTSAKNTAMWFKGKFGMIDAMVGYQAVSVGGIEDPSSDTPDAVIGKWKQDYSHTLMNLVVKATFGDFTPYIAYQSANGDAVSGENKLATLNSNFKAFAAVGLKEINNSLEDVRKKSLTSMGLGVIANLGPGKLAADYTMVNSPEWGEEGYVPAVLDIGSTMMINYEYPISDSASITAFYSAIQIAESSKLREDISTLKANYATIMAQEANIEGALQLKGYTAAQADAAHTQLAEGTLSAAASLPVYITTATSSMGVSFKMKFGN